MPRKANRVVWPISTNKRPLPICTLHRGEMSAQMSARLSAGLTVLSVAKIVATPFFRTVAGCICLKNRCCTVFSDNYRGLSCSAAQNMTFVRDAQVGRAIQLGWMPHWPWWAHSWVRAVPRGIGANRANQPNHKHTNAPKSKDRHEA